jgi:hypothetical protein
MLFMLSVAEISLPLRFIQYVFLLENLNTLRESLDCLSEFLILMLFESFQSEHSVKEVHHKVSNIDRIISNRKRATCHCMC